MHDDLHLFSGVVLDLFDFDFALVVRLENAVDQGAGGHPVGHFAHHERLAVELVDAGANAHPVSAQSVVVILHVGHAARCEVGVQLEPLVLVVCNARIDQLHKIVRQDLARQSNGDAIHST